MAWIYRIGVQEHLTQAEKENNALEFYNYFASIGVTLEAICGMLGNVDWESDLNPGMKETSSVNSGWGLIQWTPSTVLTGWCENNGYQWFQGGIQCWRIECEGTGGYGASGYWLPTSQYPYSWSQFCQLTNVETATKAYLYERERAGSVAEAQRLARANAWYAYLSGQPTPPPTPPTPPTPTERKKGMPLYMMIKPQRL